MCSKGGRRFASHPGTGIPARHVLPLNAPAAKDRTAQRSSNSSARICNQMQSAQPPSVKRPLCGGNFREDARLLRIDSSCLMTDGERRLGNPWQSPRHECRGSRTSLPLERVGSLHVPGQDPSFCRCRWADRRQYSGPSVAGLPAPPGVRRAPPDGFFLLPHAQHSYVHTSALGSGPWHRWAGAFRRRCSGPVGVS